MQLRRRARRRGETEKRETGQDGDPPLRRSLTEYAREPRQPSAGCDNSRVIEENTRFEVSTDVVATDFEGKDAVVLNLATKKYYTLNETATAIWSGIEGKLAVTGLIELLVSRYEVTPEKAKTSVLETLGRLEAQQLVRPCPAPA